MVEHKEQIVAKSDDGREFTLEHRWTEEPERGPKGTLWNKANHIYTWNCRPVKVLDPKGAAFEVPTDEGPVRAYCD